MENPTDFYPPESSRSVYHRILLPTNKMAPYNPYVSNVRYNVYRSRPVKKNYQRKPPAHYMNRYKKKKKNKDIGMILKDCLSAALTPLCIAIGLAILFILATLTFNKLNSNLSRYYAALNASNYGFPFQQQTQSIKNKNKNTNSNSNIFNYTFLII